MAIAEMMLTKQNYRFRDPARAAFVSDVGTRMQQPHFANPRSIRARLRQAIRPLNGRGRGPISVDDLVTIGPEEASASRVLAGHDAERFE